MATEPTKVETVSAIAPATSKWPKIALGVVAAVLLLMIGFVSGRSYQRSHGSPGSGLSRRGGLNAGFGAGPGGRFNGERPTLGQVTAISASSISVNNDRTGGTTTLSITSSTTVTKDGQSAAASDIKVGDTVVIQASTSNKNQAQRILIRSADSSSSINSSSDDMGPTDSVAN